MNELRLSFPLRRTTQHPPSYLAPTPIARFYGGESFIAFRSLRVRNKITRWIVRINSLFTNRWSSAGTVRSNAMNSVNILINYKHESLSNFTL